MSDGETAYTQVPETYKFKDLERSAYASKLLICQSTVPNTIPKMVTEIRDYCTDNIITDGVQDPTDFCQGVSLKDPEDCVSSVEVIADGNKVSNFKYKTRNGESGEFFTDLSAIGSGQGRLLKSIGGTEEFGKFGCLIGMTASFEKKGQITQIKLHYNPFADESICITDGGVAAIVISLIVVCICALFGVWAFRIRFGLADKSRLYIQPQEYGKP